MADLLEPWVVKSALVISALAAVNVWLFVLSVRIGRNEPVQMQQSLKDLSTSPRPAARVDRRKGDRSAAA